MNSIVGGQQNFIDKCKVLVDDGVLNLLDVKEIVKEIKKNWPKDLNTIVIIMLHMSQKDYKIQIILSLLNKSNHVRGLAKELETNQTTIARKLNELHAENIVDFKIQGKNKVFDLKKTLESKNNIFIAEQNKLNYIIKKYPGIKEITEKIHENKKIRLAILFGSYAKFIAHNTSDIDIYIETKDSNIKKELELINSKLSVKIGLYDKENLLIKEIEKNHVIIKGIELFYEKNKFFV